MLRTDLYPRRSRRHCSRGSSLLPRPRSSPLVSYKKGHTAARGLGLGLGLFSGYFAYSCTGGVGAQRDELGKG